MRFQFCKLLGYMLYGQGYTQKYQYKGIKVLNCLFCLTESKQMFRFLIFCQNIGNLKEQMFCKSEYLFKFCQTEQTV